MKFFERQKVDEIGIQAVKLEKILIALGVFAATGFLNLSLGSFVSTILSLVLLYVAFRGATKRNERLLRIYFNVTVAIFFIVLFMIVFFSLSQNHNVSHAYPLDIQPTTTNASEAQPLYSAGSSNDASSSVEGATPLTFNSDSSNNGNPSSSEPTNPNQVPTASQAETNSTALMIGGIIGITLVIVLFILKIASLVLACRIARMLRAEQAKNLAHPITRKQQEPLLSNTSSESVPAPVYIQMPIQPTMPLPNQFPYPYFVQTNNASVASAPQQHPIYFNPYLQPTFVPYHPQQGQQQ
jgi:flagellar basal body-associated protein FliL